MTGPLWILQSFSYLAWLVILTEGGNVFCKLILRLSRLPSTSNTKAGRYIGSLERLILLFGLVGGSWEVVAGVIALKTVARFKEIDNEIPAEYFLIGSLTSVLWALLVAQGVNWYDANAGLHLVKHLVPAAKA